MIKGRALNILKPLLAVIIAFAAGSLLVGGILFDVANSSRCDGVSEAEVARLEKPDIVVTEKEPNGALRAKLNEGEKAQLLELFRRDAQGWHASPDPTPDPQVILSFEGAGVLPVAFGHGFMSRGKCRRELSAVDLNQLQGIIR